MATRFLYLNEPDMIKAGVLDMKKCLNSMEDVFRLLGKGDYLMGGPYENSHGLMLWFPEEKRTEAMPIAGPDRRFMAMPAFLGGRFNVCGQKWYGSNINNKKKGLPRSILTVMLNEVETGAPFALMSANLLSAMRTGAVPGIATRYLQCSDASVIGIIGAGVINRFCLLAIAETIAGKKEVRVYDVIYEKAVSFCNQMGPKVEMDLHPVSSLEEAVRGCDIVSVAASGIELVNIKDEWIKPGAVIEITGAASLSVDCYKKNRIVMDNWKMHWEWLNELGDEPERLFSVNAGHPSAQLLKLVYDGEIKENDLVSLGDVMESPTKGRRNDEEKILFFTGGMAVEDIAFGFDVYSNALSLGIGQWLKLWDEPYLK